MKHAVRVPLSAFTFVDRHKVISLSKDDKKISFVRGKENVIKEAESVIVCFSDMEKPVKTISGKKLIPGPKPSEIVKEYSLELFDYEPKTPPPPKFNNNKKPYQKKPSYTPPKKTPTLPLDRKVDNCILSLQSLISSLPEGAPLEDMQNFILSLKRLKNSLNKNPNYTSVPDHSVRNFVSENVKFTQYLKRR